MKDLRLNLYHLKKKSCFIVAIIISQLLCFLICGHPAAFDVLLYYHVMVHDFINGRKMVFPKNKGRKYTITTTVIIQHCGVCLSEQCSSHGYTQCVTYQPIWRSQAQD